MSKIFEAVSQGLSDRSKVFDVTSREIVEACGIVWNAPSERSAKALADSLNVVATAFAECGSDFDAIRLADKIAVACGKL